MKRASNRDIIPESLSNKGANSVRISGNSTPVIIPNKEFVESVEIDFNPDNRVISENSSAFDLENDSNAYMSYHRKKQTVIKQSIIEEGFNFGTGSANQIFQNPACDTKDLLSKTKSDRHSLMQSR